MINTIIKAISIAINAEFGDGYEIYMEEIKQDLKEPCFFIQCLNPTYELFLGKRYFRRNQFCIQYFPKAELDSNRECHEVSERLNWCLEYITVNGPMHGTEMKFQIVDGVLSFFVNYDCFVYRVEENTVMENLESHITVKEGD